MLNLEVINYTSYAYLTENNVENWQPCYVIKHVACLYTIKICIPVFVLAFTNVCNNLLFLFLSNFYRDNLFQ